MTLPLPEEEVPGNEGRLAEDRTNPEAIAALRLPRGMMFEVSRRLMSSATNFGFSISSSPSSPLFSFGFLLELDADSPSVDGLLP